MLGSSRVEGRVLEGRTALVTGASGGLGAAITRRLAAEGAHVTITGRRRDALDALAAETGATPLVCDLQDRRAVDELVAQAGDVDLLVSNAALPASGALDDFTVEEIDHALDVNLRAPILLGRALGTSMAARGHGQLVFISSMGGKVVSPSLALYAATKAGLRAFGLGLREDLRASGVGVSVILPGPIRDAGMWADAGLDDRRGGGSRPPEAVAAAVIRAVLRDPPEITVAPLPVRLGALLCALRPGLFTALGRRMGADATASEMAAAQRHKR